LSAISHGDQTTFNYVTLISSNHFDKLSQIREELINAVSENIKERYSMEEMRIFAIFEPSKLPSSASDCQFYGNEEMEAICNILGLNETAETSTDIINSWNHLLIKILEKEDYNKHKCGKYQDFWYLMLSDERLPWTVELRFIIQTVLTIPIGSSQCERGFSIMNYIKDERSSRLSARAVEDKIRIKINSEQDLALFDAERFARAWVENNHMRTDDPAQQRKSKIGPPSRKKLKTDHEIDIDESVESSDDSQIDDVIQFSDDDEQMDNIDEDDDIFFMR
jgi:hypothetical protein